MRMIFDDMLPRFVLPNQGMAVGMGKNVNMLCPTQQSGKLSVFVREQVWRWDEINYF